MKFSTALGLALAPGALARQVRHNYPPTELTERDVAVEDVMAEDAMADDVLATSKTELIIIWENPGNGAATTTINPQATITKTTAVGGGQTAVPVKAATHTVKVGGPAGLVYQPDQLNNIPVGDTVVFEFLSQNHTVTQSPFDTPCKALPGGMDSGFQANPNNTVSPPPQVALQVMVTTPLWFYCRQQGHCGKGMVFSINPTAAKTQAMFQSMAIAQNGTGAGTPITGGANPPAANPPAANPPASAPAKAPASSATSPAGVAQPTGAAGGVVAPGQGKIGADGSCNCVASCAPGAFPAQAQGVGAFGGMGGSLKMVAIR
ncbi:Uncharacterized protein TCAP_02215 [Tolypocladium capitatum]|uniref:GPI-anchored cupredoxin n=1 Tax=Tolypocladium capitatum TaxID=45235 RepID=A0A2K3QJY4_9HYPO|nr:Uncharacterized protein TCAP_02215 [Tolypocladium capitatum]